MPLEPVGQSGDETKTETMWSNRWKNEASEENEAVSSIVVPIDMVTSGIKIEWLC